jgi:hypothetical protein
LMEEGRGLTHVQRYPGRAHAIAARLLEVRASITDELVAMETAAFDQAVAAITGKAAVPATPYVSKSPLVPAVSDAPRPPATSDAPDNRQSRPFVPRAPTHVPALEAADNQFPD